MLLHLAAQAHLKAPVQLDLVLCLLWQLKMVNSRNNFAKGWSQEASSRLRNLFDM